MSEKKKAKKSTSIEMPTYTKEERAELSKSYANKKMSKTVWIATLAVTFIAAFILLEPYIPVILLALLAAVLFNGAYKGLLERFKGSRSKAALVVTIYSVLVFGIPLIIILFLAFDQAKELISSLGITGAELGGFDIGNATDTIVDTINSAASDILGLDQIVNADQVAEFLHKVIPEAINIGVEAVLGLTKSIPALIMNAIIYFFVFTGLLVNQENIANRLKFLSPFSKKLNDMYVERSMAMSKAMLKGQLLIAFLQGLAGATSLAIVGLGQYFVFFLLLFTLLCLIPLGSGIILIPLGIIVIPFGYVWQGLFILGVHFIITTNIDNVIRPKVVPKEAWLPASLTILSALGGVALFGIIGVVYGPIIMILIMTTLEAYTDMNAKKALEASKT